MRIVLLNLDSFASSGGMNYLIKELREQIVFVCLSKRFGGKYGSFAHQFFRNLRRAGLSFVNFQSFNLVYYKLILGFTSTLEFFGLYKPKIKSIKSLASRYGLSYLETYDPHDVNVIRKIEESNPDIIISFFFDHIVRKQLFTVARYGMLNTHTALLPKCKGAFPVFCTAFHKLDHGFTIHKVEDETLDTGPIVLQEIRDFDNTSGLLNVEHRLMIEAAKAIVELLNKPDTFKIRAVPQVGNGFYMKFPDRQQIWEIKRMGIQLVNLSDYISSF